MLFDFLDSLLDTAEEFIDDTSNKLDSQRKTEKNEGFLGKDKDFFNELGDFFTEIGEDLEDLGRDFLELGEMMEELGENAQTSLQNHLSSLDMERYHAFELSDQNPPMTGDHLLTYRTGYTHHGLYAGNDLVIHYEKGSIHYDSLDAFQKNMATYVLPETESPLSYPIEEVMERANSRLGEANYQLIFNNCEHFVRWCRSGKESIQTSTKNTEDCEIVQIYDCNE